jgi:hypothetical protein
MEANHEGKFSMPIKQSYNANIKESREHETHELLYEFFDDYSYSGAGFASIHLDKPNKKEEVNLYLSMEKGPQELESMTKILQWRLSGASQEKGHKGGGNKRLIYGHHAPRVILHSMVNDEEFIKAETSPDDIFALSSDQSISEGDFQNKVDRDYIKWPTNLLDLDEEGAWFKTYRHKMKEAGIPVNYVLRMTLTAPLRREYTDLKYWRYLIALIQIKNYTIPIHFKNEFLGETEFCTYPNMDMIGLQHKEAEQIMELYLSPGEECIIKNKESYTNAKGEEIPFESGFQRVGNIHVYKIEETYFKDQLTVLNGLSKQFRKYTQEEFYGVYVLLNSKQTNYLPISEILPLSKNLGAELGNSLFRLIIEPTCADAVLEKLITTDTIKAKTRFKHINKAKKLVQEIIKIARINICPASSNETIAKKKKTTDSNPGQCYLIHLGAHLYKYGLVTCEEKMEKRMKAHYNDSIQKVKEFCQIDLPEKYCKPLYYTTPLASPKAFEEWIGQLLEDYCEDKNGVEKICLYQHDGSEHEQREYFTCNDHAYIIDVILPLILKNQQTL